MISKIKTKIEQHLPSFLDSLNETYALKETSPLLFESIREFVMRKGKRARPILFVIAYLGYAKKETKGLYTSALSLELLHDFMLVHDDIIDKSPLRRGEPSMHTLLNRYLSTCKGTKLSGEDLAIVIGDVMYAMGLQAFLSVEEKLIHKENALHKLIDAAVYTGCGEFIELLSGIKPIEQISKEEIYRIYDFKTACYTFATPLSMGALLAGAKDNEANLLFQYGIYLGRAFQIKDDILGVLGNEAEIGKSTLTDLQEAKKTVLIWYAYTHAAAAEKQKLKDILCKEHINRKDLGFVQNVIRTSGSLEYARSEINRLINEAHQLLTRSRIKPSCKKTLFAYAASILQV
jgi:geranylgeranyl diphosphate synthase type I